MYSLRALSNQNVMTITRIGEDRLEMKLGDKTLDVLTEDLAALVRSELPKDRAKEMFSEIESAIVQQGKARVAVKANQNIKAGEQVVFTIDINKYMNKDGSVAGLRIAPKSGILF